MTALKIARVWFAVTALAVFTGLVVQIVVTAGVTGGRFDSVGGRLVNLFCFFTIQSNVIVGVTTLLLALNPQRASTVFRVFRLDGLVAITVTGIVFHAVLAALQDLHGAAAFADTLLHTVSPVLCVLGWLLFGPRGAITLRIVGWSLVFPLFWVALTLIRGAVIDYYPYPFVNVTKLGYPLVLLNCALVGALFLVLAAIAAGVDRLISARWRLADVTSR